MTAADRGTESKTLFDSIIGEYVAPRVAVHGFRRRRHGEFDVWPNGDTLWQITCSFRKVRGRDEGWLSVTLCVGWRPVVEVLAGCQGVGAPSPRHPCVMGANLGAAGPDRRIREWRLLPGSAPQEIGPEVAREISTHGIQFFRDYGSLTQAVAGWEAGATFNLGGGAAYYRVAAYWLAGRRDEARRLLGDLEREASEALAGEKQSARNRARSTRAFLASFNEVMKRDAPTAL